MVSYCAMIQLFKILVILINVYSVTRDVTSRTISVSSAYLKIDRVL